MNMSSCKNTKSSAKCNRITSYFTPEGSDAVLRAPSTKCPLCGCPASTRDINEHLDNGCPEPVIQVNTRCTENHSFQKSVSYDKKPNSYDKIESNLDNTCSLDKKNKYVKTNSEHITENHEENLVENGNNHNKNDNYNKNENNISYRATRSVSNSPVKRNNLERLAKSTNSDSHIVSIKLTPKKSQKKLHFPSPTKQTQHAMKSIVHENDKSVEVQTKIGPHVPLTQDKKQDPMHVPYYLINFEMVLRGVLEETDDGELFLPDEVDYVKTFRALSLQARKLYVRLFQRKHSWIQVSHVKWRVFMIYTLINAKLYLSACNINAFFPYYLS